VPVSVDSAAAAAAADDDDIMNSELHHISFIARKIQQHLRGFRGVAGCCQSKQRNISFIETCEKQSHAVLVL